MAEKEKDRAEQVNAFISYGTSSHITLHLPEKIKSLTKIGKLHQRLQQAVKVVGGNYDLLILRMAECLCIQTLYIPRNKM